MFQDFVNLTWPFFVAGILLRVFCWVLSFSLSWLSVSLGGD